MEAKIPEASIRTSSVARIVRRRRSMPRAVALDPYCFYIVTGLLILSIEAGPTLVGVCSAGQGSAQYLLRWDYCRCIEDGRATALGIPRLEQNCSVMPRWAEF